MPTISAASFVSSDSPAPPTTSTVTDTVPSHARMALPRGLREEVDSMTNYQLLNTHADAAGPVRLGQWECTDARRSGSRLGPQARNFRATIAIGDCISTSTAAASGPIGALTAMLYERGVSVELLKFHQVASEEGVATFVLGTDGRRDEWGTGVADDATQSALRALVACANRLW